MELGTIPTAFTDSFSSFYHRTFHSTPPRQLMTCVVLTIARQLRGRSTFTRFEHYLQCFLLLILFFHQIFASTRTCRRCCSIWTFSASVTRRHQGDVELSPNQVIAFEMFCLFVLIARTFVHPPTVCSFLSILACHSNLNRLITPLWQRLFWRFLERLPAHCVRAVEFQSDYEPDKSWIHV